MTPVFRVLGGIILAIGLSMTAPLLYDLAAGEDTVSYFAMAIAAALFTGATLLSLSVSPEVFSLTRNQAFLTTALAWFLAPVFCALPFLSVGASFVDGYFEAVSGFTTTGSTVLVGLDDMPGGILLWRSLLNWIGGFGIVALGIIIMPFLGVGGMQLFRSESSDSSDKMFAKSLDVARSIAGVYLVLSLLCAIVYAALGMTAFDAINHAMSTIATGGYSTHDASFAYFDSPALEWAGVVFMISGGLPFVAYIRMVRGRRQPLYRDLQVRAFVGFFAAVSLVLGATNSYLNDVPFFEALRLAAFNAGSVITTTGYASGDYQLWGPFAVSAFFMLTFVGACSGSTAGGIKIYRFQILARLAYTYLARLVRPSQVIVLTYGTRRIDADVGTAVLTFLMALLFSQVALTLALAWMGLDYLTASSSVAQALSNVGPGLGPIVGPAGNYSSLPDAAKVILSFAMILGRLEFFTIFVMLTPAFWRG